MTVAIIIITIIKTLLGLLEVLDDSVGGVDIPPFYLFRVKNPYISNTIYPFISSPTLEQPRCLAPQPLRPLLCSYESTTCHRGPPSRAIPIASHSPH